MRDDLKSELVLDALGMAVTARGDEAAGVVAHSDHGSQYTSLVYGAYAKQSAINLSMGSVGDPWDNALAESFFASLEKELIRRERFATREQARLRVFWYIECLYNPRRRHSSLGMLSPIDYEQRHHRRHRGVTTRCQRKRVISISKARPRTKLHFILVKHPPGITDPSTKALGQPRPLATRHSPGPAS
jgi:Integrase core domain